MKSKKIIITLSSIILLAACGGENIGDPDTSEEMTDEEEEVITDPVTDEEVETEELEEEPGNETDISTDGSHTFAPMVAEDNFTDVYANQAWEDYQAATKDVTYGDVTILNEEHSQMSDIQGTSSGEIDSNFDAIDIRDEVFVDTVELSDTEQLHFYRYPAEEGSEFFEISDFLAELSFYYVGDNLMFSAITPGLYSLELGNLPEAETLMSFLHISEIEALDPQIFTIAEMNIKGNNIQQIMIPATHINEDGNEETLAFYFFTHGEEILYYAYVPFQLVSQDFPTNSVAVYQQFIPELEQMDLGESL